MRQNNKYRLFLRFARGEPSANLIEHDGVKWHLQMNTDLSFCLQCNGHLKNTLWKLHCRIRIGYETRPLDQVPLPSDPFMEAPFNEGIDIKFCTEKNFIAAPLHLTDEEQINMPDENKFLIVEIEVLSTEGYTDIAQVDIDPTDSNVQHDKVLVFENADSCNKLYVESRYLSLWSDYFKNLFENPSFAESQQTEIMMPEVSMKEFSELLAVIYPTMKPVSAYNVEFLLDLADRFLMPALTSLCSRFLSSFPSLDNSQHHSNYPLFDKIRLAREYNLTQVQEECLRELNRLRDIGCLDDLYRCDNERYQRLHAEDKVRVMEEAHNEMCTQSRKRPYCGDSQGPSQPHGHMPVLVRQIRGPSYQQQRYTPPGAGMPPPGIGLPGMPPHMNQPQMQVYQQQQLPYQNARPPGFPQQQQNGPMIMQQGPHQGPGQQGLARLLQHQHHQQNGPQNGNYMQNMGAPNGVI